MMNAHVIRIQASAWGERKKGIITLNLVVRPGTQDEWFDALAMFRGKPELSVTVVAPKVDSNFQKMPFRDVVIYPVPSPDTTAYDGRGMPKADVDCPEPECVLEFGHLEQHLLRANVPVVTLSNCPKPDCNLLAGHKGKCVKKKVAK